MRKTTFLFLGALGVALCEDGRPLEELLYGEETIRLNALALADPISDFSYPHTRILQFFRQALRLTNSSPEAPLLPRLRSIERLLVESKSLNQPQARDLLDWATGVAVARKRFRRQGPNFIFGDVFPGNLPSKDALCVDSLKLLRRRVSLETNIAEEFRGLVRGQADFRKHDQKTFRRKSVSIESRKQHWPELKSLTARRQGGLAKLKSLTARRQGGLAKLKSLTARSHVGFAINQLRKFPFERTSSDWIAKGEMLTDEEAASLVFRLYRALGRRFEMSIPEELKKTSNRQDEDNVLTAALHVAACRTPILVDQKSKEPACWPVTMKSEKGEGAALQEWFEIYFDRLKKWLEGLEDVALAKEEQYMKNVGKYWEGVREDATRKETTIAEETQREIVVFETGRSERISIAAVQTKYLNEAIGALKTYCEERRAAEAQKWMMWLSEASEERGVLDQQTAAEMLLTSMLNETSASGHSKKTKRRGHDVSSIANTKSVQQQRSRSSVVRNEQMRNLAASKRRKKDEDAPPTSQSGSSDRNKQMRNLAVISPSTELQINVVPLTSPQARPSRSTSVQNAATSEKRKRRKVVQRKRQQKNAGASSEVTSDNFDESQAADCLLALSNSVMIQQPMGPQPDPASKRQKKDEDAPSEVMSGSSDACHWESAGGCLPFVRRSVISMKFKRISKPGSTTPICEPSEEPCTGKCGPKPEGDLCEAPPTTVSVVKECTRKL